MKLNNKRLLVRLERIEKLIAERGLAAAPIDVSEPLAHIASLGPDMARLSEIDRKRWYCPDDPRSTVTTEEIEEERIIKARVLKKFSGLGFPDGYGQRQYRKDGTRIRLLSEMQGSAGFIKFNPSEKAEMTVLTARRELYEKGPQHRAFLRVFEICEGKEPLERPLTICESHEIDHLKHLHPDEPLDAEEIAYLDHESRMLYEFELTMQAALARMPLPTVQERLDEWHARKGGDPRLFKTIASWESYPYCPDTLLRQNQQLAEMGFEPDTTSIEARRALDKLEGGDHHHLP